MNKFLAQDFDILTSKSHLAVKISCALRTVHNHHDLAVIYVDDFLNDYPTLKGKIITSHPLTIYQCWVISRIHEFLKLIPKTELLKHSLEHDPKVQHQYSKAHFEGIYPELKEEPNNNDSKAICRLA